MPAATRPRTPEPWPIRPWLGRMGPDGPGGPPGKPSAARPAGRSGCQAVQNSAASMPFRLYSSQSGQSPFMLSAIAWLPSAVE